MNTVFVFTIFTLFTLSCVAEYDVLQICPKLNPGCTDCGNETVLVYIRTDASTWDYVIHQVWDFTGHVPTILYIIGNRNSTLDVEWSNRKPEQIQTNGSFYSFAMILNSLFEYNDTNAERVYFDNSYPHREISLRDVTWRLKDYCLTSSSATVKVRGALSWGRHRMNGTIDMKMSVLPLKGRSSFPPRLLHTMNNTQVDTSLVGLSVSSEYTAARFALRYVIVSVGSAAGGFKYSVQRSIDDEYTPGVFEMVDLMTPLGARDVGGYVQYRPVAYNKHLRDVENSVAAFVRDYNETQIPPDCLAGKYFANFAHENVFVDEVVASFGQSGDGYYKNTNYTVWTYSIGYGTPPAETPSTPLILVVTIGIAVQVIVLIYALFVTWRKGRCHRVGILEEEA